MYAVVSSGGKQYRVEPGATLVLERLAAEPGATVTFDRVLVVGDGDEVTVGTPVVGGASVSGTVLGEELGPKLVIFKFKQKVKYRRRTGHRQHLTRVRIDEITADGRSTREAAKPEPEPVEQAEAADVAAPRPSRARRTKTETTADAAGTEAATPPSDEVVEGATEAAPPKARRTRTRAAKTDAADATEAEPAAETPTKTRSTRRSARPKAETSEE